MYPDDVSSSATLTNQTVSEHWTVLASLLQQAEILSILDELEAAFSKNFDIFSPCLARGSAGIALFLGYLSQITGKEPLLHLATDMLNRAVKRVDRMPGAQFYSGYAGVAWAVEHVQSQLMGIRQKAEGEDSNEDVDEALLDFLIKNKPWRDSYDLSTGLVGFGVYALERVQHPTARLVLARVLDHLESLVTPLIPGHGWPTPVELMQPWQVKNAPQGCYNLGMAHGVPSVLLLLAAIYTSGKRHTSLDPQRALQLLEGGMTWFLTQLEDSPEISFLPDLCPKGKKGSTVASHRLAWSYGDLGASLALLNIARLTERADWEQKALEMARLAANRPLASSGIQDVSLSGGSGGNMIIFQRLYQLTREECFRMAAKIYLDHLMHTRRSDSPLGGYVTYQANGETDSYKAEPGLLDGSAGAGLALLAAIGIEPHWDRFMMLSLGDNLT